MSSCSDDSSDWSDVPELDEDPDQLQTESLFSNFRGTVPECLESDLAQFGFNLLTLGKNEKFEIFDYLKAVNYLRSEKNKIKINLKIFKNEIWKNEIYLKPKIENDPFLCFDWDDISNQNNYQQVTHYSIL
jgi:hypothetical protein